MPTIRTALAVVLLFVAGAAQAAITVVAQYRLGEADPSPNPGTAATATQPSVGTTPLAATGAPTYSSQLSPGRIASLRSVAFDGVDDRFDAGVVTSVTDNFGIEAWVRSNGRTANNAIVAYNGNSSTSGFGLIRFGGNWALLHGGNIVTPGAPVGTQWTHLALVRDNGTSRLYVNGVLSASTPIGPAPAAGNFMIGGNPINPGEYFDGLIDEVRVFTFQPGQFVLGDLNLAAPPQPIPAVHLAAAALLMVLLALAGAVRLSRAG